MIEKFTADFVPSQRLSPGEKCIYHISNNQSLLRENF